jgi:hypothetical protein
VPDREEESMTEGRRYYALCVEWEEGAPEIAFFHLRDDEELGQLVAMAAYTAPDGEAQQKDLARYPNTFIQEVNSEELLVTVQREYPTSVFLDGRQLAGSVFAGMLKTELGLPIRRPRRVKPEDPDPEDSPP